MKKVWVIFEKEVLDSVRDTRSWLTGLFAALFGPIMLGGLLILIGVSLRKDMDSALTLPVQNPEYAPALIQFLETQDVIIVPAPINPEEAVKLGDVDVTLVIPKEFQDEFSSSRTATVQLILDNSRQTATVNIAKINILLEGYNSYIGKLRLVARGINPEVIQAVSVDVIDVATPQTRAMLLISTLPYFIIFSIFTGSSSIVIDATAGERERKSLEPLLINPVARRDFVFGKTLAGFPFSIVILGVTLIGFGVVLNIIPIEKYLGIQLGMSVMSLVSIFLISLPVIFLASAIQMVVATFTRTTKEAGTYLPFISLIPSLPGLALVFFPVKSNLWLMLIPTFGQQLLINQMMHLEPISAWSVIVSTLATILVSAGITWIAVILYKREKVMFR